MAAADREGGFRSAPPVVPEGSGVPSLIEVVFRNGLGIGGIEVGGLVEVVSVGRAMAGSAMRRRFRRWGRTASPRDGQRGRGDRSEPILGASYRLGLNLRDPYAGPTLNCTTRIVDHVNAVVTDRIPGGWRVPFPGYSDELARRQGLLDVEGSIQTARERWRANERIRRWEGSPDFSVKIREVG